MRLAAKRGLKNMFSGKQEHNPHVAHWPGVTVLEDKEELNFSNLSAEPARLLADCL